MILLFEGPDGGGKDTLIEQVKKGFGEPKVYFHNGPYPSVQDAFKAFHEQIDELEKLEFHELGILNRGFISAALYGPLLYGPEFMPTQMMMESVQKRLMDLGCLVVYCIPPYEVCHNNWKSRPEDELFQDEDIYARIYQMYTDVYAGNRMNAHHYDYTGTIEGGNEVAKPKQLVLLPGGKMQ